MAAGPWGHRERLLATGAFGALLAVCGTVATVAGAASGPGVLIAGVGLTCWEALGLGLLVAYRRRSRHQ